jgi:hypothetical protein
MLAAAWAGLPENQREVCLEELAVGGVIAPPPPAPIESLVTLRPGYEDTADVKLEVMKTKLQMHSTRHNGPLDLVYTLGLITELAGHVASLGELLASVWPLWQGLSRSNRIQPSPASKVPMSQHLRDFLVGQNQSNLQHALRDQQMAARLLVAVVSGLGKGGQTFAKECSKVIDPDMIQQEMRAARGRMPTPEDLWQRYCQLSNVLSPGEIEHRLIQHIVSAAETFFNAR